MRSLQQIDERRGPWVVHADSRIALIARALPGGHDEAYRLSTNLLLRFKEGLLRESNSKSIQSAQELVFAIKNAYSGLTGVEDWGLHFGVIVAKKESWLVWTVGLVSCARWSPGEWSLVTEPQSVARYLRNRGVVDSSGFAESVAMKVANPSTSAEQMEHAEVARVPGTGIVLLGSAEFGRQLATAARNPRWDLTAATEILDVKACAVPGSSVGTLAGFVDLT